MADMVTWKRLKETRRFVKAITEDLEAVEQAILHGGIKSSEYLDREYSYRIGMRESLRSILNYIEDIKEENDER